MCARAETRLIEPVFRSLKKNLLSRPGMAAEAATSPINHGLFGLRDIPHNLVLQNMELGPVQKRYLDALAKDFVVLGVDKSTGDISFVCKKF